MGMMNKFLDPAEVKRLFAAQREDDSIYVEPSRGNGEGISIVENPATDCALDRQLFAGHPRAANLNEWPVSGLGYLAFHDRDWRKAVGR